MSSTKLKFAQKLQEMCSAVIEAHMKGYDARDVYNDRGYPPAQTDPITDADVAALEIKAVDVEHAMQFFENLEKMLNGEQITPADYRSHLNKMRLDL